MNPLDFWPRFHIVVLGIAFFFTLHLLFPISIWTFISHFLFGLLFPFFYLDFCFPFLFGLLFRGISRHFEHFETFRDISIFFRSYQSRSDFGFLPIFFTKMNHTKISSFYWKHFKIYIPKKFYFPWKGFEHYSSEHFLQISRTICLQSLAELIKRQKILTYNKLYRNWGYDWP